MKSLIFFIVSFFSVALPRYAACFEVNEITGDMFAAEVIGLHLPSLSNEEFEQLHSYLLTYKVLILRNQSYLSVEEQREFTSRFGPLQIHLESSSHHPNFKDVNIVSNIRNVSGGPTGLYGDHVENFHSDLSWSHLPTKFTFLRSDILPNEGGDTHFADSTRAYESLSSEFKLRVQGLQGHYSYLKFRDHIPGVSGDDEVYLANGQRHPLITTHPVTGLKNIYANPAHTAYVVGVSDEESQTILSTLFDTVSKPEFRYEHKWRQGDAAIWDNRALHHRATPAPSSPRRLIRTTVLADARPQETIELHSTYSFSRARSDHVEL